MCNVVLILISFVSLYLIYLQMTTYDCHIEVVNSYKTICYNNGNPYSCIKLRALAKVMLRNETVDNKNIDIECDISNDGSVINCTDEYNNIRCYYTKLY
jgi:hypothetical protein